MKKFLSIFLVSIMIISLSACASPQSEEPEEPTTKPIEKTKENDEDRDIIEDDKDIEDVDVKENEENKEDQVENQEAEVNIFYTSEEYVITGNEDLDKLDSEKRTVTYGEISLEEAVLKELLKDPEGKSLINSIPNGVNLIEVKVEDNIAYVDFNKNGMEGGSLEEILTIDQIVTSLLDLGTVSKVQFLLNGEVSDTLMGHISTTEPFDSRVE